MPQAKIYSPLRTYNIKSTVKKVWKLCKKR